MVTSPNSISGPPSACSARSLGDHRVLAQVARVRTESAGEESRSAEKSVTGQVLGMGHTGVHWGENTFPRPSKGNGLVPFRENLNHQQITKIRTLRRVRGTHSRQREPLPGGLCGQSRSLDWHRALPYQGLYQPWPSLGTQHASNPSSATSPSPPCTSGAGLKGSIPAPEPRRPEHGECPGPSTPPSPAGFADLPARPQTPVFHTNVRKQILRTDPPDRINERINISG